MKRAAFYLITALVISGCQSDKADLAKIKTDDCKVRGFAYDRGRSPLELYKNTIYECPDGTLLIIP